MNVTMRSLTSTHHEEERLLHTKNTLDDKRDARTQQHFPTISLAFATPSAVHQSQINLFTMRAIVFLSIIACIKSFQISQSIHRVPCQLSNVKNVVVSKLAAQTDGSNEHEESPEEKIDGNIKIDTINSRDEFLSFINKDDRLCCIKVYANWCKSCAKFGMYYNRLAHQHGDIYDNDGTMMKRGKIRFAQIEYGSNIQLCKSFGIKKLPYVLIYKLGVSGPIDEFVCGPSVFKEKLEKKVDVLLSVSDEDIEFYSKMERGQTLGDTIVSFINLEEQQEEKNQKSI